jgi:hypothetical protein
MAPFDRYGHRWETASGLEHTCWFCDMKANNPKARQQCYGIHGTPCYRYHQFMHAIGSSHRCKACNQADTSHAARHREIAEKLTRYQNLVAEEGTMQATNGKGSSNSEDAAVRALRDRHPNAGRAPNSRRTAPPTPLVISTQPNHLHDDAENNIENIDDDDDDSSTSPSTETCGLSPAPKLTKAETRNAKRAAKSAKSQRKSLKNQTKNSGLVSVRDGDIELIEEALHGNDTIFDADKYPLSKDRCFQDVIARNEQYLVDIQQQKAALLRKHGAKRRQSVENKKSAPGKKTSKPSTTDVLEEERHAKPCGDKDEIDPALVDAVLARLGIDSPPSTPTASSSADKRRSSSGSAGGSQEKAVVIAQLRNAISEDLKIHQDEQQETCRRTIGFWTYCNNEVFVRLQDMGERIVWKTGAKKHGYCGNKICSDTEETACEEDAKDDTLAADNDDSNNNEPEPAAATEPPPAKKTKASSNKTTKAEKAAKASIKPIILKIVRNN